MQHQKMNCFNAQHLSSTPLRGWGSQNWLSNSRKGLPPILAPLSNVTVAKMSMFDIWVEEFSSILANLNAK